MYLVPIVPSCLTWVLHRFEPDRSLQLYLADTCLLDSAGSWRLWWYIAIHPTFAYLTLLGTWILWWYIAVHPITRVVCPCHHNRLFYVTRYYYYPLNFNFFTLHLTAHDELALWLTTWWVVCFRDSCLRWTQTARPAPPLTTDLSSITVGLSLYSMSMLAIGVPQATVVLLLRNHHSWFTVVPHSVKTWTETTRLFPSF